MRVVLSPEQDRHEPRWWVARGRPRPCPERPERAERLGAAARAAGHAVVVADRFGAGPRAAVHDARYLAFLETAWERWSSQPDAGPEVVPNVFPGPLFDSYPGSVTGQAGWHMADTSCPVGPGTWEAATGAADAAVHAAEIVLHGAPSAYALCRPPGHHAFGDRAAGFCYLNNAAIAAQHVVGATSGRVAVLDIDVHHGNGTQAIFYGRGDVLTVSVHCDPADFYPFFGGFAHETGTGEGEGRNLNLPLPRGTTDTEWLAAIDRAIGVVREFDPAVLVVGLGLDALASDPFAAFAATVEGYAEAARRISRLGLPSVLIQEGGYLGPELGPALVAFLGAFEAP
ncbi:histone deacetylase family protein [Arenibaculum pallidiluteum]|uniref:histone deacetylase family protein n=1 Tax=Arenibaculum pallidiluteum TaxID=2812559 RepID=UPI001A96B66A|nr:histone deacetylase family protein [Arenibaculum pallidiluteum]